MTLTPASLRLRRDAAVFTDKELHATVKAEARRKTDMWATGFDAEDGKKYTKVVTNPETGRKNRIRYGAKGLQDRPGHRQGRPLLRPQLRRHEIPRQGLRRRRPQHAAVPVAHQVALLGQGIEARRSAHAGKVAGLSRTDAPKGAQGKPCGASHISREYKCSKNTGPLTAGNLKTAAKVALAVGALAGGAYLTKRGMMSMDEWRKSPQSARNNPKLSPEKAQQIADEAIAGGQKWDAQEKINARRQAELNTECGIGLGKVLAPAKFDALILQAALPSRGRCIRHLLRSPLREVRRQALPQWRRRRRRL
jgi:hypothetical protein